MKALVNWICTPIFLFVFFGVLVFFHPLLFVASLFGIRAHHWMLVWMNRGVLFSLRFAGVRFVFENENVPQGRGPFLVVSNHQSMYDIPMIIVTFGPLDLRFIAKEELGRWIPSISLALRKMQSLLIQRSSQREALAAIESYGARAAREGFSVCIFPEGTRARDGVMKSFKPGGLTGLIRAMPEAPIVPVSITGSWRVVRYKFLPVEWGARIRIRVLPTIQTANRDPRTVIAEVEDAIREIGESALASPPAAVNE